MLRPEYHGITGSIVNTKAADGLAPCITRPSAVSFNNFCRSNRPLSSTGKDFNHLSLLSNIICTHLIVGNKIVDLLDVQSTPVISRLLGAKIRECELSGSPVISRCRAKATTREFRITDPHSQAFTTLKQYVERGTYVSRISTHIDIAPATNHNNMNKQH